MDRIISVEDALRYIDDECTIMINGFMGCKCPDAIIDAMLDKGVKDLTIISNDTSVPGKSVGKLVSGKRIRRLVASHIGLNPETGKAIHDGEIEVELVPQGTLAERIRCGGAGIGGFLTPTGLGTEVENGKRKLEIEGKEYLLELPLHADVAILHGSVVDTAGNVWYRGTTQNFSPMMAMAADVVIVEAERIVDIGEIAPESVMTPGIFVDWIVPGRGCEAESWLSPERRAEKRDVLCTTGGGEAWRK